MARKLRLSNDLAHDLAALLVAHGIRVRSVHVNRLPAERTVRVYDDQLCGEDVPRDFPVMVEAEGVVP